MSTDKLLDERCFADPRFTTDQHGATITRFDLVQRAGQVPDKPIALEQFHIETTS
jgi:hypothetical protein